MALVSILIVEDEAMTAMLMETLLRRRGYKVLKCISSGEEAVEYAIENTPDLVLMDIRLAGVMDGVEATERIMAGINTPVQFIFTTGYSDFEYRERALRLNPLAFLVKPVNMTELLNAIESFFNG